MEATCAQTQRRPSAEAADTLIDTCWAVKTERAELTQALLRSVAESENDALLHTFAARVDKATTAIFCHAPEIPAHDVEQMNLLLTTLIDGYVRIAFERALGPEEISTLKSGLKAMWRRRLPF